MNRTRPANRRFELLPARGEERYGINPRVPAGRTWSWKQDPVNIGAIHTVEGPWLPKGSYIRFATLVITVADQNVYGKYVMLQEGETPDDTRPNFLGFRESDTRGTQFAHLQTVIDIGRYVLESARIAIVITSQSGVARRAGGVVSIQAPQPVMQIQQP